MKKEKFTEPELEIINFDYSDIVTESGCSCDICDTYVCTGDGRSCCQPQWGA